MIFSEKPLTILAIESSCDETACAIVQRTDDEPMATVLSSTTATSLAKHKATKGIVPEVAAREQLKYILPVIEETLGKLKVDSEKLQEREKPQASSLKPQEGNRLQTTNYQLLTTNYYIDAIAVTIGPGLVGSLLVGIETARALAMAWNLPIIPVNHVQAHPYANFIENEKFEQNINSQQHDHTTTSQTQILNSQARDPRFAFQDDKNGINSLPFLSTEPPKFPLLSWVISGGHTDLYFMRSHNDIERLGGTVDDAAGECFDKCARVLGFDYPGGPFIEKLAEEMERSRQHNNTTTQQHDNTIFLPRPLIHEKTFNLSFSGLKTAFLRAYKENLGTVEEQELKQILATELQEAISDLIVKRTGQALEKHPEIQSIIISGGVAANKRIREKLENSLQKITTHNHLPTGQSGTTTRQHDHTITQQLYFPPLSLCTDNAAMIGAYATFHLDKKTNWDKVRLELKNSL